MLTSSHEKVFSSGGNLAGFAADVPLAHKHRGIERFPRLFRLIGELGKPTLCAANGHVLAGALGLALACDLIVAREGVRFGTPEINVGVFPFMIMALIYRNVGRKKTNELLLLGEQISAEEAERIGIVNRVVPAEEFDAFVADWAAQAGGQVAGADADGQGRDVPPAGHGLRGGARLPARAARDRVRDRRHPGGREGLLREARPGVVGPVSDAAVVALRCRTSDRTAGGARGAEALAPRLGRLLGVEPRMIGSPGEPRPGDFADDLRDSRGCLLEAGGQVDDAMTDGRFPVLLASDCSICITTLPTVLRHHPEARIAWLDAHGDFNTPETTPSGFLGGMCLAAACGRWDAGLGDDVLDPARVVMTGVRDLDGGERVELERAGVGTAPPDKLAGALEGDEVYVHLDLDVLDPSVLPAQFPAPGGLSSEGLRDLLGELAESATVIGVEITAFDAPEDEDERDRLAAMIESVVEPLL